MLYIGVFIKYNILVNQTASDHRDFTRRNKVSQSANKPMVTHQSFVKQTLLGAAINSLVCERAQYADHAFPLLLG